MSSGIKLHFFCEGQPFSGDMKVLRNPSVLINALTKC